MHGKYAMTRVQLDFPEPVMDRLRALKKARDSTSYSETVRAALRVYEAVVAESDAGSEMITRRKDGTEIKWLVP